MLLLPELSELLQAEDPEERQTITGVNWNNSELLPNLDLSNLAEYVIAEDPLDAAIAFRVKIKEMVN
ncbi:hypothetical protein H6G25_13570 [Dolichospermum sp. FACHB-1091]|uniref:hypothetical protein n=1 Tax=Dolichospermum sp. FACHB-1091 TaxID=2692798 RepID=UPI00167FF891|nr:hypothetical protein [Dolichospermum sp. FACHB-1091]MBD2444195.1 hypothetical protein [Dolichospermum sp. FACHB-1091]